MGSGRNGVEGAGDINYLKTRLSAIDGWYLLFCKPGVSSQMGSQCTLQLRLETKVEQKTSERVNDKLYKMAFAEF